MLLELRDGSKNRSFGSATGNGFGGDGIFDGEALQKVIGKKRRDFAELGERKFEPGFVLFFCFPQDSADKVMRLTKGNALANEIVGSVGGK